MPDQVVQTILKIGVDTAPVQNLANLLKQIQSAAQGAQGAIHGIKGPGGGGGGGGSGPGNTAAGGGGGGRKPRAPLTPEQFMERRFAGGFAAHLGGMALQRAAHGFDSAIGQYYAQEPAMAGAAASGNLSATATAVIQAQAARESAMRQGVFGTAGGVAASAAPMIGAMAGGMPGMLIGTGVGAVLNSAVQWGVTAANALTQTVAAQRQGAVTFGEMLIGKNRGIATSALAGMPYGMGASRSQFQTMADVYGYTPDEVQGSMTEFGRSGGWMASEGRLMAAARAGIAPSVAGRWQRSMYGASGAILTGGADDRNPWSQMDRTLANAVAYGVQRARLPELLGRVAAYNERLAERGINIDFKESERERAGLAMAGMRGFQVNAAQEAFQAHGQQTASGMAGMLMPGQLSQGILMRGLLRKYGSMPAAIRGANEMVEKGEWGEFVAGEAANLPEIAGVPLMMGVTGMSWDKSKGLLGYKKRDAITDRTGQVGAPWLGSIMEALGIMQTDEGRFVAKSAGRDAAETLTATLPKLTEAVELSYKTLEVAQKNFLTHWAGALQTAIDYLTGNRPMTLQEELRGKTEYQLLLDQ